MRRVLSAILAFLFGGALPVLAQTSVEGSLRGHVKDEQGAAVQGVTVTATSPTVPGSFTATSDAEGYYRLLNLPPGEYKIEAELPGFAKYVRQRIFIRAGLNLGLEITMKVGTFQEVVEVKLDTPMTEIRSAEQTFNVSGDLLRNLAVTSRRKWSDSMALIPGVASTEWRAGDTFFYARGTGHSSGVFQIDGADAAAAPQSSNTYINLNTDAIADAQIKPGALDASTPIGLGVVVNVATRSGTNDFSGAVTAVYKGREWNGNNEPGGTSPTERLIQADVSLSGPVKRDRIWFFAAYRRADVRSDVARSASQAAVLEGLGLSTPPESSSKANFWFAKVTGRLSSRHSVDASYQQDEYGNDNPNPTATALGSQSLGGPLYSLRLTSLWNSAFHSRLNASYNGKTFRFSNRQADQPWQPIHRSAFASGGRLVGSGAIATTGAAGTSETDWPYSKYTLAGDASWFLGTGKQSHEIQFGFFLQPRLHQERITRYAGGGIALDEFVLQDPNNLGSRRLSFHRQVYDAPESLTGVANTSDIAFYAQDSWRVTSRLTAYAGVRFDRIRSRDEIFDTVTQQSTEIGPRFGINYQLSQDGRNVARASWARLHATLSETSLVGTSGTSSLGFTDYYDTNLDGVFETVLATPGSTTLSRNRQFDLQNFHQPFADELTIGYRRQWKRQVMLDAGFVRREYKDAAALVEVNARYEDGVFRGYRDETQNQIYRLTSNQWKTTVVSELSAMLVKQGSGVQGLASYTRQWRHVNGTWTPGDPASLIQPDAFPNDRGVGNPVGSVTNTRDATSLSGFADTLWLGPSGQWRDHTVRLALTAELPWSLHAAAHYVWQSGPWSGPVLTRISAPDTRFGPPTVTLSNGRLVSNPLATTFRFAFPTRGEGQFEMPNYQVLNVRLGRRFAWRRYEAEVAVDGYNITDHDADQTILSGGTQTFNPNFRVGTLRQAPRSATLSVRLAF